MSRQDIAPVPGGLRRAPKIIAPQGLAPVTDAFPAGVGLHLLETGFQVIRLSPCHADLPSHRPLAPGHDRRVSAMLFSLAILSDPGKASDPEISPLISARCSSDTAVRLMAHRWFEPNTCHHLRKRPASWEFSAMRAISFLSHFVSRCVTVGRCVAVCTDA